MALKDWKKERHLQDKTEIGFWRYKDDSGFVAVYQAQKGSPYYEEGKFFSVEISTADHLKSEQFKTKSQAIAYAHKYMRNY